MTGQESKKAANAVEVLVNTEETKGRIEQHE
jgi:hypothetical protein